LGAPLGTPLYRPASTTQSQLQPSELKGENSHSRLAPQPTYPIPPNRPTLYLSRHHTSCSPNQPTLYLPSHLPYTSPNPPTLYRPTSLPYTSPATTPRAHPASLPYTSQPTRLQDLAHPTSPNPPTLYRAPASEARAPPPLTTPGVLPRKARRAVSLAGSRWEI
jgi:hypothetical protein